MKEFLDLIKNIMVICCLCATLCATCRQEQASDRMTAEIATLKNVSDEMRECVYVDRSVEE